MTSSTVTLLGDADVMENDDGEGTSGGVQSDIVHQGDDGNGGGGVWAR